MKWSTCGLLLVLQIVQGQELFDPKFVNDVMHYYSRTAVIFHLPMMKSWQIFRYKKMSEAYQAEKVFPVKFMYQTNANDSLMHAKFADEDFNLFMLDSSNLKMSVKTFETFINHRTRTSREFWMIDVTPLGSIENAELTFNSLLLDVDDDVFFVHFSSRNMAKIWEVYKLNPSQDLILNPLGSWSTDKGMDMTTLDKFKRRGDLKGYKFRCATLPSNPYISDMVPIGPDLYKMYGMFAEVFDNIATIMNFTYDLTKPPDGQWGAIQPDGSWSGMVGMLSKGEIDMAPTDFTVTMERSAVMTFANPITQIYHSLFIKNPTETYNYTAYTEPMHWLSWVILLVFIGLVPPFLWFNARFPAKDSAAYHEFTLGKSYVYLCSALTMRGWSDLPVKPAAQIALFALLFFGTMMYWHWEAMLISYLATRVTVLPFNSIPELISTSQFRIILTPGSSYEDAFKTSRDPDWMVAWTDRVQPHLEEFKGQGTAAFTELLETDTVTALYDNYFSVISFQQYSDCKIIAIPAKYDFKPYAYGFQKDSPFLDMFNYYLKEMREKGSLKQILAKFESPPQVCPDYSGKPLGFGAVFTAFGVLIFGAGIAIILFCIEIIAMVLGLNLPFLYSYGVGDAPPFNETNILRILMLKDDEITELKQEVNQLKSKMLRR